MLAEMTTDPIRCERLSALGDGVAHGFFTRHGGVSEGLYRGLNAGLGSDDRRDHVAENRRLIAATLGVAPDRLTGVHQIHSADAIVVDRPIAGDRPKADAIVTAAPGLAVSVLTADCGPVLFADGQAGVVAAAHAGWKGALTGILESTIATMESLGASRDRIVATLGPTISQANYEVGPEFVERFAAVDADNATWFSPSSNPGRSQFDLTGYIVHRLRDAGVNASALDECTYADEERFFSYRRTTHRNEPDYGRQMSAIKLDDR